MHFKSIKSILAGLGIIYTFYLIGCVGEYDKADFILSENTSDKFSIILGENCGEKIEISEGRKQYFIPENNLLIVQNNYEELPIDYKFFRLNKQGKKQEIGINYHREEDGRPYPGVRILGFSESKVNDGNTIKKISFKILNSESDPIFGDMDKEKEQHEVLIEYVRSCRNR